MTEFDPLGLPPSTARAFPVPLSLEVSPEHRYLPPIVAELMEEAADEDQAADEGHREENNRTDVEPVHRSKNASERLR